jgi:hypothetical protein
VPITTAWVTGYNIEVAVTITWVLGYNTVTTAWLTNDNKNIIKRTLELRQPVQAKKPRIVKMSGYTAQTQASYIG